MDESDRRDNRQGFVRELIEGGNEAAEANLAKDLAERMLAEYNHSGHRGDVIVDRTVSTAVLVDAIDLFQSNVSGICPVLTMHYSGLLREGRFIFIRRNQL